MSRTVLWLMAAGAVVGATAVVGVAWHSKQSELNSRANPPTPATSASPAAAASRPAELPPQTAAPEVAMPSFDIARIGPDGRAVIAGGAPPGAKIVLLDGGKEIAQGQVVQTANGSSLHRIRRLAQASTSFA